MDLLPWVSMLSKNFNDDLVRPFLGSVFAAMFYFVIKFVEYDTEKAEQELYLKMSGEEERCVEIPRIESDAGIVGNNQSSFSSDGFGNFNLRKSRDIPGFEVV